MSEIPVPVTEKKLSKISTAEKDPVSVLQSRGLLNIDKMPVTKRCPTSEIDLTFYTEEAHLGELVKLFSSTHKFRNGKLVYSTVQEVAPQLPEEVDKFNKWWQLESGQNKNKKQAICQSLDSLAEKKRKSLLEMQKEAEREEIIRRYDSRTRKCRDSCEKDSLNKLETHTLSNNKINSENNLRDQRIKRYFESQNGKKFMQEICKCEGKRYDSVIEKEIKSAQDPVGKKVYHAKWVHRSPKKSPSKSVRFTIEEDLENEEIVAVPESSANEISTKSSNQNCRAKSVPSISRKNAFYDDNEDHLTSSRKRIEEKHHENCEEEWVERLSGLHCRHPYTMDNNTLTKSSIKAPNKQRISSMDTFSNSRRVPRLKSQTDECSSSVDYFETNICGGGDTNFIRSDSSTSVCTVFYDDENCYPSKQKSSSTSNLNKREMYANTSPRKYEKGKSRATIGGHALRKNSISCPSAYAFSSKTLPKISNSSILTQRHCCHRQSKQSAPKATLDCYAQCHKRNKNDHHLMVKQELLETSDSEDTPEDVLKSMHLFRKMINKQALKEFKDKYSKTLHKHCGGTNITSYAKEQFIKQIHDFHGIR